MVRFPGKQLLTKHLLTKFLALLMAAGLWLYITNEQNPLIEQSYPVPLEIRNSGKLMVIDAPDSVSLRLRGAPSVIAKLSPQNVKAYVDLSGLSEGKQVVQVHAVIPNGLDVVEVNPDKVTLRLDVTVSKEMPIGVRMTGAPAAGMMIAKTKADTDWVVLQGAKSLVDLVDKVETVIDISGKNASFSVETPLVPLNREEKAVEGVSLRPGKLKVSFVLMPGRLKKAVNIKPNVDYATVEPGYVLKSIVVDPSQAELSGDTATLAPIDSMLTEPIPLKGMTNSANVQVKLQLKDGVTTNVNTVVVHIVIDKKQEGV